MLQRRVLPAPADQAADRDHGAGGQGDRALAAQVRHDARAVRAHGGRDRDRLLGDRRRDGRQARQLRLRRQHRHDRRLRPRVGRPHRPRQPQQPARRVHLRRAVAPRRPRRHVARHEPGDPRVLRGGVGAVVGGHRRPARRARGRLDPRRRRRRGRPDREPLPLPLPEGAVPRLRDDDDGAVVRADLARHRQPAAARGGRAHGAHRQRHRRVAALGAARVRDAEPRLRRRRPRTRWT